MRKPAEIDILKALPLFGRWFRGPTWHAWTAFLAALFGLPMSDEQAAIYQRHTGRTDLAREQTREAWVVAGRRAGKSVVAALVAVFLACFRHYIGFLGPGEVVTIMVIAADRRQARVVMRYISGFLESVPMLARMIIKQTLESITLSNRVAIEVHTASFRSTRGYTIGAAVCDEIAFWRSDESANPDSEIIGALRPGLATVPGSLLLCISSPYARRGALWDAYQKHFGKPGDPVLIWQADSYSMNPTIDPCVIERAYEEDESAASAEYGAQFRRDIETYISREAVAACVIPGRLELPYVAGCQYRAFVDPSGGSQDSFTLAIAHADKDGRAVLDCVRERRPPFSPEQETKEYAETLKTYHLSTVRGDRYAGEWPREAFRKHGIQYEPSEKSKSEIYQNFLAPLNSGKVELLDNPRLVAQLCSLERRTARGGRDSIDHGPGGHDDLINSASGALVETLGGGMKGAGIFEYYKQQYEKQKEFQGSYSTEPRELSPEAQMIRGVLRGK